MIRSLLVLVLMAGVCRATPLPREVPKEAPAVSGRIIALYWWVPDLSDGGYSLRRVDDGWDICVGWANVTWEGLPMWCDGITTPLLPCPPPVWPCTKNLKKNTQ